MILAANQPYFSPFPGFFQKILCSDVFIVLDTVQFPRGFTWITRNRFKNHQGPLWLTVPVWKKGLGLQPIDQVGLCHEGRWHRKHLESLKKGYAAAPYLQDHLGFLEALYASRPEKLAAFNMQIITYMARLLGIDAKIVLLSDLHVQARGEALALELCRTMGASCFLAQRAAAKYLNPEVFREAGIQLKLFRPPSLVYPQLWGDFLADCSTWDLVLNCGPKAREILVKEMRGFSRNSS